MKRLFVCISGGALRKLAHIGGLRTVRGSCGAVMGGPWGLLGQWFGLLGRLGALLGRHGAVFAVWRVSWDRFGAVEGPS